MKKKQDVDDAIKVVHEFAEACEYNPHDIFIGIDPGATGAIAFLCGKRYAVIDIPGNKVERSGSTKAKKKTTTVFDIKKIVYLFNKLHEFRDRIFVCLEKGQVQIKGKGANAYTGFRVGCAYGMWPLFLESHNFQLFEIHPTVWKKDLELTGKDKEVARQLALKLFPEADITRKEDHNRAEALLLAQWYRSRKAIKKL